MELQQKQLDIDLNEPFEIVRNARKNSKQLKSISSKTRKNSTISLADEKQKKIKKKSRKFTLDLEDDEKWFDEVNEYSQKGVKNQENIFVGNFLQYEHQNKSIEQVLKWEKEQKDFEQKQQQGFYFKDHEGEKGILQGIGDENSLGRQFNFDFFNPEKYSR